MYDILSSCARCRGYSESVVSRWIYELCSLSFLFLPGNLLLVQMRLNIRIFSGYLSSRLFKQLGGSNWRSNAIRVRRVVNDHLFRRLLLSSQALHCHPYWASTFSLLRQVLPLHFLLVPFWHCCSCGCCCCFRLFMLGAWVGEKRPIREYPRRANVIPRQIPSQPWYLKTISRYAIPTLKFTNFFQCLAWRRSTLLRLIR